MKVHVLKYWGNLWSSFWFLPSAMAAGAVALALAAIAFDRAVLADRFGSVGWAYTGGAEGASAVLQTIAGSMITIAGVVFSLTLVALSLASSQFGPRVLRNFMRDTTNQFVLGTFVATFVYCLLVLRSIRRTDDIFVPHLSVTIGVVFALASLAVLIFFIHHVSVSIQADRIVARIGGELLRTVDHLYPDNASSDDAPPSDGLPAVLPSVFDQEARVIRSPDDGYVLLVDIGALTKIATEEEAVLRLERRVGEYVVSGQPLAHIWPGRRPPGDVGDKVRSAFVLGSQRAPGHDLEFTVIQLVEIAVRALSPGVNDPFTAIAAVDRLGSALSRLAQAGSPSAAYFDDEDHLRLVVSPLTFPEVLDTAFNQIREYGLSSSAVTERLLETLATIAGFARRPEDRAAIRHHADMIARGASAGLPADEVRRAVQTQRDAVIRILEDPSALRSAPPLEVKQTQ
ncbi:MAG: DUF2254 domain-containing protein [Thermoleophilia bacterium]